MPLTQAGLISPSAPPPAFDSAGLQGVAQRIVHAREAGRAVIWMMGANVVTRGLSLILIDLLERGVVTHVATNGAGCALDLELALTGETRENPAAGIEDGPSGIAEETGAAMHEAIAAGVRDGLGYGEAVGRFVAMNGHCRHPQLSVAGAAYRLHIPFTVHRTIGADAIDRHPAADFAAMGWAGGQDLKAMARSVAGLEGGVVLNTDPAVAGSEILITALSVARNLGHPVEAFTTANLVDPGGYQAPTDGSHPHGCCQGRATPNPPVSLGGREFHITGDHAVTIPSLYHLIRSEMREARFPLPSQLEPSAPVPAGVEAHVQELLARRPELAPLSNDLLRAYRTLALILERGGTIFICGNGGSLSDALHISGELLKSFERPRAIEPNLARRLAAQPGGADLAAHLQRGLRAVVLGANTALASAVQNDLSVDRLGYAQELLALARPGDALIGISTSGNAENVCRAAATARALGLPVIALTGGAGGRLAPLADVALRAPALGARLVQELHLPVYHALCLMLETHFFAGG